MRFLILLLCCGLAHAAELVPAGLARAIPAEARRGVLQAPLAGSATIGGASLSLAPGLQIRDGHNRIVLPASLQEPQLVRYLVDGQGQLARVWILTAAEAARP